MLNEAETGGLGPDSGPGQTQMLRELLKIFGHPLPDLSMEWVLFHAWNLCSTSKVSITLRQVCDVCFNLENDIILLNRHQWAIRQLHKSICPGP